MSREVDSFPKGVIDILPSKSVSHRAIICGGLSRGECRISNIVPSQDNEAAVRCMNALGYTMAFGENSINCGDGGNPSSGGGMLDCGESGTTLRFLIPIAALRASETVFTGQGLLMRRPLTPYMDALSKHGVTANQDGDFLRVRGPLTPGRFTLPGDVSSQFVSGLLLALPLLDGDSVIELETPLQSASYVALTVDMMARFGVVAENEAYKRFVVKGGQKYHPANITVEADYSHAAFFLTAGALGCDCACRGLSENSRQGDRAILEILERSGVQLAYGPDGVRARAGRIAPQTVDMSDIPDLAPPVAALLAFAEGESRLVNAGRLRHKESDRLEAIASALNGLGANIEVCNDELVINGVKSLSGGVADSRNDHRIAMMSAVAAIRSDGPVRVTQSGCVAKSYPKFWDDFCRGGMKP